jgi:hypothetical protein
MSSTRNYLDYLDDKVDISPVNSQEELDEAQLIRSLMDEHGLETSMQEFSAPLSAELPHAVLYIVLVLGTLLSGFLGSRVALVGLALVVVSFALLAARYSGRDPLARLGRRANSQNVIGVHRASGPLVMKGNRPIVIVAHYDSPSEDFLYSPGLARYQSLLKGASFYCVIADLLCAVIQLVAVLPAGIRHLFWVVGIVAAIPLVVLAASIVYARFSPCTVGANDNKSSVAAMLGVMDKVRPGDDQAKRWAELHPRKEEPPAPMAEPPRQPMEPESEVEPLGPAAEVEGAEAVQVAPAAEADAPNAPAAQTSAPVHQDATPSITDAFVPQVIPAPQDGERAVRRGTEFIQSLHILPEDCEIVYDRPPVPDVVLPDLPPIEDLVPQEVPEEEEEPEPQGKPGAVPDFFGAAPQGEVQETQVRPKPVDQVYYPESYQEEEDPIAEYEVIKDEEPSVPQSAGIASLFHRLAQRFSSDREEGQHSSVDGAASPGEVVSTHAADAPSVKVVSRPHDDDIPHIEKGQTYIESHVPSVESDDEGVASEEPEQGAFQIPDFVRGNGAFASHDNEGATAPDEAGERIPEPIVTDARKVTSVSDEQPNAGFESAAPSGSAADAETSLPEEAPVQDEPTPSAEEEAGVNSQDEGFASDTTVMPPLSESLPRLDVEPPAPVDSKSVTTADEGHAVEQPAAVYSSESDQVVASDGTDDSSVGSLTDDQTASPWVWEQEIMEDDLSDSATAEEGGEEPEEASSGDGGWDSWGSQTMANEDAAPFNPDGDVPHGLPVSAFVEGSERLYGEPSPFWDVADAEYETIDDEPKEPAQNADDPAPIAADEGVRTDFGESDDIASEDEAADEMDDASSPSNTSQLETGVADDEPTLVSHPVKLETIDDVYVPEDQTPADETNGLVPGGSQAEAPSADSPKGSADEPATTPVERNDAGETTSLSGLFPAEDEYEATEAEGVPQRAIGYTLGEEPAELTSEDYRMADPNETAPIEVPQTPEASIVASNPDVVSSDLEPDDLPFSLDDAVDAEYEVIDDEPQAVGEESDKEEAEQPRLDEPVESEPEPAPAAADDVQVEPTHEQGGLEGTMAYQPTEAESLEDGPADTIAENMADQPMGDASEQADAISQEEPRVLNFVEKNEVPESDVTKDDSGLDPSTIDQDVPAEPRKKPAAVDDPTWGTSDFVPPQANVARRAVLFDLPDPAVATSDPLGGDDDTSTNLGTAAIPRATVPPVTPLSGTEAPRRKASYARGEREPIGFLSSDTTPQGRSMSRNGSSKQSHRKEGKRRFGFFGGRSKAEDESESMGEWLGVGDDYDAKSGGRAIGNWKNFEEQEEGGSNTTPPGHWKGGATRRFDLRLVDGASQEGAQQTEAEGYVLGGEPDQVEGQPQSEAEGYTLGGQDPLDVPVPDDEQQRRDNQELVEAITGMDDDEILAHDIYFVALGASSLRHAGMEKFLEGYRKSIRGAFLINLDSVGAGQLTVITNEGASKPRRADRRLVRLLLSTAQDLHIPLERMRLNWGETDATQAMRASVRGATIMGVSEDGVPALSHTAGDVPENVSDLQAADVTELVAELIRRS